MSKPMGVELHMANPTLESRVAERSTDLEAASRFQNFSQVRYESLFADSSLVTLLIDPAGGSPRATRRRIQARTPR